MATTGNYLGFIATLARPEMVGVNPEVAHEQMAGLNFVHAVAQAWEAGKLFHIDLNDQAPGRYDQDFRFGAANPKAAFFLVKFLEDVGYAGPRHFDAHAYRTENYDGVKDFARGCMRTYLILKEKAARWNADAEIQALVREINGPSVEGPTVGPVRRRPPGEAAGVRLRSIGARRQTSALRAAGSADGGGAAGGAVGREIGEVRTEIERSRREVIHREIREIRRNSQGDRKINQRDSQGGQGDRGANSLEIRVIRSEVHSWEIRHDQQVISVRSPCESMACRIHFAVSDLESVDLLM